MWLSIKNKVVSFHDAFLGYIDKYFKLLLLILLVLLCVKIDNLADSLPDSISTFGIESELSEIEKTLSHIMMLMPHR